MRGPPPALPSRGDAPPYAPPVASAAVQQAVLPPPAPSVAVQQAALQPPPAETIMQAPLPPPPAQHTVFLPPMPQVAVNQGCDCNIPADANQDVKLTRHLSALVIGTHTIALVVYGYLNDFQIIASLFGMISGGVLLCCFQRNIYLCTPIIFIIAAVFDLVAAIMWMLLGLVPLALLPVVGLAAAVGGAVFGFRSYSTWDEASGVVKSYAVPTVAVRQSISEPVIEHIPGPSMPPPRGFPPAQV